ncbi:Hcp family type VI secretion system effector [Roseateles toxinivorans]|uniref:Type VI secretion system Hcp family effector n=1 Tax=Roseateles toxinivorans TaxID=270368 RepID=A0A4R6QLB8_9BURK|nr:type VI secretion system tube protein Hcp [Roseateles toxinivorans]TDP62862.1 type VI secretion system Hcp family effector [Roseateles toxinivorans]
MPGNSFIKFDGIKEGESFQSNRDGKQGWIEIGDWSWDIEAETSFTKGGGAAVGKPTPGTLSFSHFYDLSSPVIMGKIVGGQHFAEVVIDMLKQTGDKGGLPSQYFQIKMKEVFITKVSSKGGEDGSVNQDVEMVFKEIAVGYKPQKNDGTLEAPTDFNWNIARMNLATSIQNDWK